MGTSSFHFFLFSIILGKQLDIYRISMMPLEIKSNHMVELDIIILLIIKKFGTIFR